MPKSSKHQNPVMVIVTIKKDQITKLRERLESLKDELIKGGHAEFENIGTIHYARWFIIDDDWQNPLSPFNPEKQGAKLVFSSNFDGDKEQHYKDLSTTAVELLDSIYDHCCGYPEGEDRTIENRVTYLKLNSFDAAAFYRGSPDRSLPQIRNEKKLRNYLRELIDAKSWEGRSSKEVFKELQHEVRNNPDFNWVTKRFKIPGVNWLGMGLTGIVLLVLLPIVIVWILVLHFKFERKDENFELKRSDLNQANINELETYEDLTYQNQFSQVVVLKDGFMRHTTFNALMLFARVLIKFLFVRGKLMGIPTIHFARWVKFDNNRRVLFCSNFDGSWVQYLGDFIDKSGWGLTGIFSNTVRFPKTNFLFFGGAYDEEHFLAWSRNTEVPTQIWYDAYPELSIKNVNNNSLIRSQIFKNLSEQRAKKFLKLL